MVRPPGPQLNRGITRSKLPKPDNAGARADMEKAIQLDPNGPVGQKARSLLR